MLLRFVYGAEWAAQGVFTLFALLFVFIGAQFVGLGLLGEYIGRIYHDVRSRPRFFIKEIRGKNNLPVDNEDSKTTQNSDGKVRKI